MVTLKQMLKWWAWVMENRKCLALPECLAPLDSELESDFTSESESTSETEGMHGQMAEHRRRLLRWPGHGPERVLA